MSDIPVHDDDCPFSSMRGKPILHSCSLKRIAELEAELADYREMEKNCCAPAHVRAEKAEAEVERLTLSLLATEDMLLSSNRDDWAVALAKDRKKRVNPSGDRHLGGAPPGVSPSPPSPWSPPKKDSVWCYQHQTWEDGPYGCLDPAARKERDGG